KIIHPEKSREGRRGSSRDYHRHQWDLPAVAHQLLRQLDCQETRERMPDQTDRTVATMREQARDHGDGHVPQRCKIDELSRLQSIGKLNSKKQMPRSDRLGESVIAFEGSSGGRQTICRRAVISILETNNFHAHASQWSVILAKDPSGTQRYEVGHRFFHGASN